MIIISIKDDTYSYSYVKKYITSWLSNKNISHLSERESRPTFPRRFGFSEQSLKTHPPRAIRYTIIDRNPIWPHDKITA